MGVVYRARQVLLNRPCALKMILSGAHATLEAIARFRAEAAAIARLHHAHIVQIHHIGEAGSLPFFELEYVEGGSLDRDLDGSPWPPRRAAHLVEQLARGIAEAHRRGVVHRDLKPSNVLLARDGTPKVGDFGLAKLLDSESGLTRTDSVLGSPSYMAPEQAEGKTKEVGPAADGYALGAILYELLVGAARRSAVRRCWRRWSRSRRPSRCHRRGWCRGCRGTWRRSR
jgi:serine/threonine protein kinase